MNRGSRMRRLAQLREKLLGLPEYDDSRISDEWFRSHFHYASDVVAQE